MSLTLGEKLRQAREERGISVSEVAEQTRISPHYLDSIENDDYRTLPGGIFNKGFVKSYAKYVGIDEQEALRDYSSLLAKQEGSSDDEPKTYKPEVLTDDRASSSLIPTIIFAVIILGLMTWGLLTLVNYIQNQQNQPVANTNTTAPAASPAANSNQSAPAATPSTNELKVELKTSGEPVPLQYSVDDQPLANASVTTDKPLNLSPEKKIRFIYYRSFGAVVQLSVNGKTITAPAAPIPPKKNSIEYEVNKENLAQILQSGQIPTGGPANSNTNAATSASPAATR